MSIELQALLAVLHGANDVVQLLAPADEAVEQHEHAREAERSAEGPINRPPQHVGWQHHHVQGAHVNEEAGAAGQPTEARCGLEHLLPDAPTPVQPIPRSIDQHDDEGEHQIVASDQVLVRIEKQSEYVDHAEDRDAKHRTSDEGADDLQSHGVAVDVRLDPHELELRVDAGVVHCVDARLGGVLNRESARVHTLRALEVPAARAAV
eukprot:CAMPEP_0183569042 /NCGR_PEP_ID=MMETSP0371-20130417/119120_1 /TAXON_ID=268820 /ORGANISM="Peridinium aciculiferum, Strain PAER-2" /LENGTH=206 /DNA_ID=CAMNT_0025778587 /DNA_START=15 /DNA_END=636 /DNA_ORIENTATION=-